MALLRAPTAPAASAPQGPGRSGLGLAAAASLALHAGGLAAALLLPEHAALPEELVIEVVLEAPPQSLAAAPSAPEPAAQPEEPPEAEPETMPAPEPDAPVRDAPVPAPPAVERRPPRPAENPRPRPAAQARAEATAAPPAPPEPASDAAPPVATKPAVAEAGERAAARRQDDYLRALLRWLEPHRRYPRAARLRGVEGTVRLRLTLDRTGGLLEAAVEQSSGAPALDRAALAMAAEAGPAPPFPEDWPAPRAAFVVPVRFALAD